MSGDRQQSAQPRRASSTRLGMTDRPDDGRLRISTAGAPGAEAAVDTTGLGLDGSSAAVKTAVQVALQALVTGCRSERLPLPIVARLMVNESRVELHLAAPLGEPPQPWTGHGHVWSLEIESVVEEPVAAPGLDPYPALVYLGTVDDRAAFADLGAAPGLVEIAGPDDEVRVTLARLARSLGDAPWSRGVEVVTVGTDIHDHAAGPSGLGAARALLSPVPDLGGVSGRWGRPPRGTHTVVLCSEPLGADDRRLVRAASRHRGAPTVVAPQGDVPRGVWRWSVEPGVLTW